MSTTLFRPPEICTLSDQLAGGAHAAATALGRAPHLPKWLLYLQHCSDLLRCAHYLTSSQACPRSSHCSGRSAAPSQAAAIPTTLFRPPKMCTLSDQLAGMPTQQPLLWEERRTFSSGTLRVVGALPAAAWGGGCEARAGTGAGGGCV